MTALAITVRPHVFSGLDEECFTHPAGGTVAEVLQAIGWNMAASDITHVYVAGDAVAEDRWHDVTPYGGAEVLIAIVPAKGGNGKSIGMAIAALVVSIAAPYAAAAIAPALGITSTAGTAALGVGLSIAGNLAVSAIFKPSRINNTPASFTPQSSPAYSISGQSNAETPYQPCVKVYGWHKVFPRIVAKPLTDVVGAEQFLTVLLDWGYAPLSVGDIRIGDTPITNYADVQVRTIHYPYSPMDPARVQTRLELYPADAYTEALGIEPQWKVQATARTRPRTKIAVLTFYFPQGLIAWHKDFSVPLTNVVESRLEFRRVTNGVIGGWQGFTSANLVQIQAPNRTGLTPTSGFAFYVRPTTIDADVNGVPTHYGFQTGCSSFQLSSGRAPAVGDTFLFAGASRTVTATGNAISFTPALDTFLVTEEARRYVVVMWDGAEKWAAMEPTDVAISVSPTGSILHIEHNELKPFAVGVRCEMPSADEWEFGITRLSEPRAASHFNAADRDKFDPDSVIDVMQWIGIDSFVMEDTNADGVADSFPPPFRPRVPHTVSEIRIRASEQLSGVLQQISGMVASYLPVYRSGAYAWELTAQSAWIVRDILCGDWNPRPINPALIDDANFAEFAALCEARGFRFDTVIEYGSRVDALIESVLAGSRGTITREASKYRIIADGNPGPRRQVFSSDNSWGMVASRQFPDIPHALRVKWIDPDSSWQERTMVACRDGYYDPEGDPAAAAIPASTFEDFPTVGVITAAHAWKLGRIALADIMLRPVEYKLNTDLAYIVCAKGQRVGVQSTTIGSGGATTRVAEIISANLLRLRDPFGAIDPAGSYGLVVKYAAGGDSNTIACTPLANSIDIWKTAVPHGAEIDDVIVWGFADSVLTDFLVKDIEPGPKRTAKVTLVDLGDGVMQSTTGTIPKYFPPKGGRPQDGFGIRPQSVKVELAEKIVDRVRVYDVRLTWAANVLAAKWNVYRVNVRTGALLYLLTTTAPAALALENYDRRYIPAAGEELIFEVRGVSRLGTESPGTRASVRVVPDTTAPLPPRVFLASVNARMVTLSWSPPEDDDVVAHQIRFTSSLATYDWTSAEIIASSVARDVISESFPARIGTYLIKTLDSAGNYSTNPAVAKVREITDDGNVVLTQPVSLSSGTSKNCTVIGGQLKADSVDRFWLRNDLPFWGADDQPFWRPAVYFDMQWTFSIDVPADGIGTDMRLDVVETGSMHIEHSRDSINWATWAGQAIADAGTHHYRISIAGGAVQGIIASCSVVYDVPDIEEIIAPMNLDAAGTRIPITKVYRAITVVLPMLDKSTAHNAISIGILDLQKTIGAGPLAKGYDAAGAAAGARSGFIVKGY